MDTIEEIKNLKSLLDQGAITEEEFQLRKKEILAASESESDPEVISQSKPEPKKQEIEGTESKTELGNELSADSNINPANVMIAGKKIRKSVKFNLLTSLSSFLLLILFMLLLIIEVIPATIQGDSIADFYDWCSDFGGFTSIALPLLAIMIFIFWIKSLTTLNKAGNLLEESSNMNYDKSRANTRQREPNEYNKVALISIVIFILLYGYLIISDIVQSRFNSRDIMPLLMLLFAIVGGYMALKHIKWTFLTGIANILIQFYFLIRVIIYVINNEGTSIASKFLINNIIALILLTVFVYSTLKYFRESKSE